MKKAYFQYYETFENILEKIKDIEESEHMRKIIINYGLYGTLPAGLSELEEMAWTICKDLIDQQYHRREVNAANRAGKKAESATNEENSAIEPQPEEKPAQEIQPEKPKRKNFVKPTVEEIAAYCSERKNGIDPQAFFDFYESKGWKVGAVKMKDWRASVRTWEQRHKSEGGNRKAGGMWGNENEIPDEITDLF